MCNNGKNSNNSQFFFNFAPAPQLNGKHVILGKIGGKTIVILATNHEEERPLKKSQQGGET